MKDRPARRDLYDAILNLQGAMMHGFTTLAIRMDCLDARMGALEARFHEFDEDAHSFRIEVRRRFDRVEARFPN